MTWITWPIHTSLGFVPVRAIRVRLVSGKMEEWL